MREAERVLGRWFAAFEREDMDAARKLWAHEGVLHATAPAEIAGDVRGFDEFLDWYARRQALTGARFGFEVHDLVGNDRHAVALIDAWAESPDQIHRWRQICVYHVADGRITEMWIHEVPGQEGRPAGEVAG